MPFCDIRQEVRVAAARSWADPAGRAGEPHFHRGIMNPFIETPEQIAPTMQRALASDKPYLLNVDIEGVASPFTQYQLAHK